MDFYVSRFAFNISHLCQASLSYVVLKYCGFDVSVSDAETIFIHTYLPWTFKNLNQNLMRIFTLL